MKYYSIPNSMAQILKNQQNKSDSDIYSLTMKK